MNINTTLAQTKLTRIALALGAAALLPLSALAAPVPPKPPQAPTHQQQAQVPLTVSYYAGNPAQGGRLLRTVTLAQAARPGPQGGPQGQGAAQPPRPGQGQPEAGRPQAGGPEAGGPQAGHHRHGGGLEKIKAQAPAGATFAVVKGPDGKTRVIDLSRPQFGAPRPNGHPNPGQPSPGQPSQPGQPPRQ